MFDRSHGTMHEVSSPPEYANAIRFFINVSQSQYLGHSPSVESRRTRRYTENTSHLQQTMPVSNPPPCLSVFSVVRSYYLSLNNFTNNAFCTCIRFSAWSYTTEL